MNKMYIIPIVSLVLLAGLLVFGLLNASSTGYSDETSFLGNFGSSSSDYQIVEVGGYQFKIPSDLKFAKDNVTNEGNFNSYAKFYTIDGNYPSSNKGLWVMVWKDYPLSLNEFKDDYLVANGFIPQKISISGYSAYKCNNNGESIYTIQVNNDIISVYVWGYSNEISLVETVLSLIFADSNNIIGGNSQSSISSSNTTDENNSTDDSDSKKDNNKNSGSSSNNNNNKRPSNEEPKPPSDDYGSGGTGGGYHSET